MEKAPVSFDVFAISPQGYEVHFQLNGEKVYQEAVKLLAALTKDGFTPKLSQGGKEPEKVCPVHQVALRRRQNGKGAWYSHKLADGSWCHGQAQLARHGITPGGGPTTRPRKGGHNQQGDHTALALDPGISRPQALQKGFALHHKRESLAVSLDRPC